MTRSTLLRGRVAAVLLVLGPAVSGCGAAAAGDGPGAGGSGPDGRLVMVSGRDDHGLLASETVPLYAEPGSDEVVGEVADATLVHVRRIDGTWLLVTAAEGEAAQGWIDDFHLRGELRLVGPAPSCASELAGQPVEGGTAVVVRGVRGPEVLVAAAADPSLRGWVPREDLQELPPQGLDCGEDPPGDKHTH